MKGVWDFLKTREWSVAVVPPFDPYLINQSFLLSLGRQYSTSLLF
jgi:hypothetical protein